jgi:hypothetical protein
MSFSGRASSSDSWLRPQRSFSSSYSTEAQAGIWQGEVLKFALKKVISIV